MQDLSQGMRVPCGARTRPKVQPEKPYARRVGPRCDLVDPDVSRKPRRRTLLARPIFAAQNLHCNLLLSSADQTAGNFICYAPPTRAQSDARCTHQLAARHCEQSGFTIETLQVTCRFDPDAQRPPSRVAVVHPASSEAELTARSSS